MFLTEGDVNKPIDVYCLVTNSFVDNTYIAKRVGYTKKEYPVVTGDIHFNEDDLYTEDWSTVIGKLDKKRFSRKIKPVLAFSCAKIYKVLADIYHYLASKDSLFSITFIQYRFSFGVDSISNRELKIIANCYRENISTFLANDPRSYTGPFYKLKHYFDVMLEVFLIVTGKVFHFGATRTNSGV